MTRPPDVEAFLELAALVETIVAQAPARLSWERAMDAVFSPAVAGLLRQTGLVPDYCDPDTSYEEDVVAYRDAVVQRARELREQYPEPASVPPAVSENPAESGTPDATTAPASMYERAARACKTHVIACADCTAGHYCVEGRALGVPAWSRVAYRVLG